ncbi:MAG: endolytic transglycosylase MltG [Oscillospiraceae bacterium]|nr:endolytic transglycosylase MltG [Oscillospiraceae bacterium]
MSYTTEEIKKQLDDAARKLQISSEKAAQERQQQIDSMESAALEDDSSTGPTNFNVRFDFNRAYRDLPEAKPLRFRREKRSGLIGGLLYAVFVICISLVLASLAWLAATDVLGFGAMDEEVSIIVPRGFTLDEIIDSLYDSEVIKYKFLFNLYAGYSNAEGKISPGSYILNKNYDYRAIVYGLSASSRVLVETTVTIPEGYTLAEIFQRLEDYGVCYCDDLWEVATNNDFNFSFLDPETIGQRNRLEGYLFPETYNFYLDSSPTQVLNKFLNEFNYRYTELFYERAASMGYTTHEIITIASMIEREAGSDDERSRIAAVIYNRLNNSSQFPMLQIDATIYYAIAQLDIDFSTAYDSPYNTYINSGLPPGPISNPGIESITAALYPDTTNEYYYALTHQGTHKFSRTLAEHDAFVASPEYAGN